MLTHPKLNHGSTLRTMCSLLLCTAITALPLQKRAPGMAVGFCAGVCVKDKKKCDRDNHNLIRKLIIHNDNLTKPYNKKINNIRLCRYFVMIIMRVYQKDKNKTKIHTNNCHRATV